MPSAPVHVDGHRVSARPVRRQLRAIRQISGFPKFHRRGRDHARLPEHHETGHRAFRGEATIMRSPAGTMVRARLFAVGLLGALLALMVLWTALAQFSNVHRADRKAIELSRA